MNLNKLYDDNVAVEMKCENYEAYCRVWSLVSEFADLYRRQLDAGNCVSKGTPYSETGDAELERKDFWTFVGGWNSDEDIDAAKEIVREAFNRQ